MRALVDRERNDCLRKHELLAAASCYDKLPFLRHPESSVLVLLLVYCLLSCLTDLSRPSTTGTANFSGSTESDVFSSPSGASAITPAAAAGAITNGTSGQAASTLAAGRGVREAANSKPATTATATMPDAMAETKAPQRLSTGCRLAVAPSICREIVGDCASWSSSNCLMRNVPRVAHARNGESSKLISFLSIEDEKEGREKGLAGMGCLGGAPKKPVATALASAASTISGTAAADVAQPVAPYEILITANRRGPVLGTALDRGRSPPRARESHAGTAVECDEYKAIPAALGEKPSVAEPRGERAAAAAATPVAISKAVAGPTARKALESTTAAASTARWATHIVEGALLGAAFENTTAATYEGATDLDGDRRSKMVARAVVRACTLGSVLLLVHTLLCANESVVLFFSFQALHHHDAAPVRSWLPAFNSKYDSTSSSNFFLGLHEQSVPPFGVDGSAKDINNNRYKRRVGRIPHFSLFPDDLKANLNHRSLSTCDDSESSSVGIGLSSRDCIRGNTRNTRVPIAGRTRNDLKNCRGPVQLLTLPSTRVTHNDTCNINTNNNNSSPGKQCNMKVECRCATSDDNVHAFSAASSTPGRTASVSARKHSRANPGGPWLLFALADVAPSATAPAAGLAAFERTAAGCEGDCVCLSSSPAIDRSGGSPAADANEEERIGRSPAQVLQQQQDLGEVHLPAQEQKQDDNEAEDLMKQQEQELEREEEEAEKEGMEEEPEVGGMEDELEGEEEDLGGGAAEEEPPQQPFSDQQGIIRRARVHPGDQQPNEQLAMQYALNEEYMGQDSVQRAELAYLHRQQALSATVSNFFPVSPHYDFIPLTKRLSTAKRLNLLEESECYEEYFSADATEAVTDVDHSSSGGAGSVTEAGGALSSQNAVENFLTLAQGGETAPMEEEGGNGGERETEGHEVADGEEAAQASGAMNRSFDEAEVETSPTLDFPAVSYGQRKAHDVERKEGLCLEDGKEWDRKREVAAHKRSPGVSEAQSNLQEQRGGEKDADATTEELPVHRKEEEHKNIRPVLSPLRPTAADGEAISSGRLNNLQRHDGVWDATAGTATGQEQVATPPPNQPKELVLPSSRHNVELRDRKDVISGAAVGGAASKTASNVAVPEKPEEESVSSEGEEEEVDGEEDEEEAEEEDLTSHLLVRRQPVILDVTSAGSEDLAVAGRRAHDSFSANADAFTAASLSRPFVAQATRGVPAAAVTYSYSGATVGSPLPSSYGTLPLLLSAYNGGTPPGVLPGVASPFSAAPGFTSPANVALISPALPSFSPHPPMAASHPSAGAAELRFDSSASRPMNLLESNTTPAFNPPPTSLSGASIIAAASPPVPTSGNRVFPRVAADAPSPDTYTSRAAVPHSLTVVPMGGSGFLGTSHRVEAIFPQDASQRVMFASSPLSSPNVPGNDASPHSPTAYEDGGAAASAMAAAPAAGTAALLPASLYPSSFGSPQGAGRVHADAFRLETAAGSSSAAAQSATAPSRPGPSAAEAFPKTPADFNPADQTKATTGVLLIPRSGGGDLGTPSRLGGASANGSAVTLRVHPAPEGVLAGSSTRYSPAELEGDFSDAAATVAVLPELTAGSTSTEGDAAILAASMDAAAAAQMHTSATPSAYGQASAAVKDRHTTGVGASALGGIGGEGLGRASVAAAHGVEAPLYLAEERLPLPGEQTPRRLLEGIDQQKLYTVDPSPVPQAAAIAAAPRGPSAAVEKERGPSAAAGRRGRGEAGASDNQQRQRASRKKTNPSKSPYRRGREEEGAGKITAGAPLAEALLDNRVRDPSSAIRPSAAVRGIAATAADGRRMTRAFLKSGAAVVGADAEGEGGAAAIGAPGAMPARPLPTGGTYAGLDRLVGAKEEGKGDIPEGGRDAYPADAGSDATTVSTTGATSSLAEASFKKPSDALKNLVARQDAGEWQHERDSFERHYPFKKPLLIRSTTTGRIFEIAFDSVLGAGGQGVVFAATIISEGTGVALKIFRIRPDQRRDDGREEGMLRRRVQSELNVWDFIPGGLSPREWSEFAHLVIPLDVVQPLKMHKAPPRHEVRYATQWIMMDLFAGDMARMPKIMSASANVKMEVTEQMFLSNMRLHDMGLVHSDIKLPNFFIGMDGRIFLGDHSLATPIGENVPCMSGTVRYLPPENMKCINDGRRRIMTTERKDVWALGIVLYKLWCGQQYPYELGELWSRDLFVRAARAHVEELDLTGCDKMATVPILGLLRIMLTPQVGKRPTLREIHKFHPLFAAQKNTLLRSRTLHSLLEEIQTGRGTFEGGKFTNSLPLKSPLFGDVGVKR